MTIGDDASPAKDVDVEDNEGIVFYIYMFLKIFMLLKNDLLN